MQVQTRSTYTWTELKIKGRPEMTKVWVSKVYSFWSVILIVGDKLFCKRHLIMTLSSALWPLASTMDCNVSFINHYCPDWNNSTIIRWITMNFNSHFNVTLKRWTCDLGDPPILITAANMSFTSLVIIFLSTLECIAFSLVGQQWLWQSLKWNLPQQQLTFYFVSAFIWCLVTFPSFLAVLCVWC